MAPITRRVLAASTDQGDVIWEPFGGLFTASLAATRLNRGAFAAERDLTYYQYGVRRFTREPIAEPPARKP